MVDVTIYTRPGCPYCTKAKALLSQKNVAFNEINAGATPELRAEMQQKSGRNTFPQIFVGDYHVGGCDDLHALDATGKLGTLLETGTL
ncbi:glutaredoxin 3 [Paenochrobactrum sp. BZR 588]|uniref:glutaredoxin 3 n=1 Tax=unclassified Paenochrobactrum TaxID=2639760 RepID=UPI003852BACD